ncbi:MAG: hypothetical protein AAFY67_19595, partial [Cyanobacteria bacterium J06642_9]
KTSIKRYNRCQLKNDPKMNSSIALIKPLSPDCQKFKAWRNRLAIDTSEPSGLSGLIKAIEEFIFGSFLSWHLL